MPAATAPVSHNVLCQKHNSNQLNDISGCCGVCGKFVDEQFSSSRRAFMPSVYSQIMLMPWLQGLNCHCSRVTLSVPQHAGVKHLKHIFAADDFGYTRWKTLAQSNKKNIFQSKPPEPDLVFSYSPHCQLSHFPSCAH